jgi:hypothetical protein
VKTTTVDMSVEKKLVTLAIMSTPFLTKIAPIVKPSTLQSGYAREVLTWVLEYFTRYRTAPEGNIKSLYEQKRAYVKDEDTISSIGDFLEVLSDEYVAGEYTNLDYHVDQCEKHIKACALMKFKEKLEGCIAVGEIEKAEQLVSSYEQSGIPQDTGVSILSSHDDIREAFTTAAEPLFRFPGALGKVCGNFYRGDVSLWMAYSKGGKSYGLLYSAEQAMMSGCRVTFISLEMRKSEAIQRAYMALTRSPKTEREIRIPSFHAELEAGAEENESTIYTVFHENEVRKGVQLDKLGDIESQMRMRCRGGDIRMFFLPAESTSIEGIEVLLDNLEYYQRYNTDVLIIDYADLLGGGRSKEYRHLLDEIYRHLRRIAQERNIHTMTASQSSSTGDASKGEGLDITNLAEDKRKASHAARVMGIYATPEERQDGVHHIKNLIDRYEPETYDHAIALHCYTMGRFCIDSRLSKQVDLGKKGS